MRRVFFISGVVLLSLYVGLHLLVGSAPVQRRLFAEIRSALHSFGIDLEIDSIEFSAFAPRIFLNRVVVRPLPNAKISLKDPLQIDKIKLELEPLGLLSRKIVIGETTLFYPQIIVPQADKLFRQVTNLVQQKKALVVKGEGAFQVVFKRLGVVDALFEIQSQDPPFSIRSRSLSVSLEQSASGQQSITLQSKNLEFERKALKLSLNRVDLDIDATAKSIRINRWIVEGDELSLNIKGGASLPLVSGSGFNSLQLSYEAVVGLRYANGIAELHAPFLQGLAKASGTLEARSGTYLGQGKFEYGAVAVDGYGLGSGSLLYRLDEKKAHLSEVVLKVAKGELRSHDIQIDLSARFPVKGEFKVTDLSLSDLVENLKIKKPPVFGSFSGSVQAGGYFSGPLQLEGLIKHQVKDFYVLNNISQGRTYDNTILEIAKGEIDGRVEVSTKGVDFHSLVRALEGEVVATGHIDFNGKVNINAKGKGLSLSRLKHIAELSFAGVADLEAQIEIGDGDAQVGGAFQIRDAEVAEIVLGKVEGTANYADRLLTFEKLQLQGLEPIRGSGYLDFRPKDNHYQFNVGIKRAAMDHVFSIFKRFKLPFPKPTGGEVGASVTIEGGHDNEGLQVNADGQGRMFDWYGERWMSSNFSVIYRPRYVELRRASLLKRSGALDVRGHFEGKKNSLAFSSNGLLLQELNYFGKSPLSGELSGHLRLEGDLTHPAGQGELRLQKGNFRGTAFPDSFLRIRTEAGATEFLLNATGNRLRARLVRSETDEGKRRSDLLLYFREFDFAPVLSAVLKKDIPTLSSILASGDIALKGVFDDWRSMSGSGTITDLTLGLREGALKNEKGIQLAIGDGAIRVDRFRLLGKENQLSGELHYQSSGEIRGGVDGKIDMSYLQPFVPGLESGVGKVAVALRLSGSSSDFKVLGNVLLEDGNFRIVGLAEDFRSAKVQLTVSQDRINVDRFNAVLGGGQITVKGDILIKRFAALIPNLRIIAERVVVKTKNALSTNFSGELSLKGEETPYLLSGRGVINEARLTDFNTGPSQGAMDSDPVLTFDIKADARERLFVTTDVMDAEFKGNFNLVGNSSKAALLGTVEGTRGQLLFKETRFNMTTASVRFEDAETVRPRFNVAGRAVVREQKSGRSSLPQDYEVLIQVIGTPENYKIRLTSTPTLSEPELISLLVLGVTSQSKDGNYSDLGSVIAGQVPFQSKLQNELGVDIKMGTRTGEKTVVGPAGSSSSGSSTTDTTVPSVKIEKGITKNTKLSYSTTVGEDTPYKEFRIEHMLNDSFTLNGTAVDRSRGTTSQDTVKSYGLDFRYHFTFE